MRMGLILLVLLLGPTACAGVSAPATAGWGRGVVEEQSFGRTPSAPTASAGPAWDSAGAEEADAEEPLMDRLLAEVAPQEPAANEAPTTAPETVVASDGRSGPLLIYEAQLWLAVFEVEARMKAVIAVAAELGGYLASQSSNQLVLRVPAAKFQEALERIEQAGEVTNRQLRAHDVTDQFRDLTLRLRNAEQVRDRLAALLAQAKTVQESLAIERELDRISERIESMKGQLKFLSNRIAYSTLTVQFGIKQADQLDDEVRLPFPWLDTLGLGPLLEM